MALRGKCLFLHSISRLLPWKLSDASKGSGSTVLYRVFSTRKEFNDLLFLTGTVFKNEVILINACPC